MKPKTNEELCECGHDYIFHTREGSACNVRPCKCKRFKPKALAEKDKNLTEEEINKNFDEFWKGEISEGEEE